MEALSFFRADFDRTCRNFTKSVRNINHQIISAAILEFINQKIDLKKGIKLVDGLGVSRVVNHLLGDKSSMKLTKN